MASSTPETSLTDMETTTAEDSTNTRSDGWFTAYYRGHKLRAIPTAEVDLTSGNPLQPSPPIPRPQKKPQRLPPLPRGEFKVVMRPRDGLNLSNWKPYQVAQHISTEAKITIEELHAATKLQLNHDRNIVIVSTAHIEVVQAITQIHHLRLGGKDYPTYTYVASPDNSIKGVVHDIEPGSSPEKLLHHLEAPGYRILHARLLGNTGTALVTFEGRKIPPYVQYQSALQRCFPYRPIRQVCTKCLVAGHRADVCPTPHIKICLKCAVPNPPTDHVCAPKCTQCHGDHPTNDTSCPQRFAKPRATQRVSRPSRRGGHGNTGRDRSNSRRQQNQTRSQSRPASRTNSRPGQQPRGNLPGPKQTPAGASAKQEATSGQALQSDNTRTEPYTDTQQVSWATRLTGSQTLPPTTNPLPPLPAAPTTIPLADARQERVENLLLQIMERLTRMEERITAQERRDTDPAAPVTTSIPSAETICHTLKEVTDNIRAHNQKFDQIQADIHDLKEANRDFYTTRKNRRIETRCQPYPPLSLPHDDGTTPTEL
ncbi:uncharacterized protein ISCGN_001657 [Ixodes scapularis]